jgi:subtilisin family serine protease
MKKTRFGIVVVITTILASCTKEIKVGNNTQADQLVSTTANRVSETAAADHYMPNEILVKFKSAVSDDAKSKAFEKINGIISKRILTQAMQRFNDREGIYLIKTPLAALEAISKIQGEEIEYAEPNYIYTHDLVSNDPYFTNGSLWGMSGNYGCNANVAWANGHTGSSTVFVGVIDEGAMYNHEDLGGNFWTNPYDPVDGADNDHNGYIDDVHGWDFYENNNSTYDGSGDDHGTHVSGTIGAIGANGKGVVGVNWSITIISAKFLGPNGGTTADAIEAVDYITNLKILHGLNIVATNNSWGGGGFSQGLQNAIERANTANILFVAAAGNGNQAGRAINIDSKPQYPASYPNDNIIAVAAIDKNGAKASWSNYGATSVDLGAPGVSVYSTLPNNSYGSYSGTSMATPHVTGAAALYASTHTGSTAAQIKKAILDAAAATPTSSLAGKCVTGGRLNVSGF